MKSINWIIDWLTSLTHFTRRISLDAIKKIIWPTIFHNPIRPTAAANRLTRSISRLRVLKSARLCTKFNEANHLEEWRLSSGWRYECDETGKCQYVDLIQFHVWSAADFRCSVAQMIARMTLSAKECNQVAFSRVKSSR